jgi:hypothetical protein
MTTFDLNAASEFITTHARTLDRRRFERVLGQPDSDGVIAALAAYRNPDNGSAGVSSRISDPDRASPRPPCTPSKPLQKWLRRQRH